MTRPRTRIPTFRKPRFFELSLQGRLRRLVLCGAFALPGVVQAAGFGSAAWFAQAGATPAPSSGGPATPGLPAGLPGVSTPEQALIQADRSLRDLNRSIETITAARQVQTAAQQLAISLDSNIPDGHTAGGLLEVQGATANQGCQNAASCLWVNAELPVETLEAGRNVVTVEQTGDKSILTWDSLSVGRNTTLHIDQRAGTQSDGRNNWVSLNRVRPGAEATVVQGQIKAEGSVYLINQNGVLFSGSSQVNVHSLLVSTLPLYLPANATTLAETTTAQLSASNRLFLESGLASVGTGTANGSVLGLADSTNLLIESAAALPAVLPEDIRIERGAQLSVNQEGFALIAAPNVYQQGHISASDSQVVIAAGAGVMLSNTANSSRFGVATGGRISDASNGGADITPQFELHQEGLIESLRGSVSLRATRVDQDGVIVATTSVSRQGSLDIQARDVSGTIRNGAVTLGGNSLTAILPDDAKDSTNSSATADDLFRPLGITLGGAAITLEDGALIEAPGHSVTLTAVAQNDAVISSLGLREGEIAGRVYLSPNAVIDVAGLANIEVPLSNILVTVPRLGLNELADSPLQRSGPLFAQPVVIDSRLSGTRDDGVTWVGSPIANLAGYVEQVPRGVRELLSNGGKIDLAGNEVIGREGSVLNLSGGYIHYLGGVLNTTRLVTAAGAVVDIGSADPNVQYVGFAGQALEAHPRWNLDQNYLNPVLSSLLSQVYEGDDVFGGDAGTLSVFGQSATLLASTISGQSLSGRTQINNRQIPLGGAVNFGGNQGSRVFPSSNLVTAGLSYRLAEQLPTAALGTAATAGTPLAPRGSDAANLDDAAWWTTVPVASLREGGISRISVLADVPGATSLGGEIVVDAGTTVAVRAGGSINLSASRIAVNGNLLAPSGSIALTATGHTFNVGSTTEVLTPASSELPRGDIVVAAGSHIDASGVFVNDAGLSADEVHGNAFVNGGSIRLVTQQSSVSSRLPVAPDPDADPEADPVVPVIDLTGSILLARDSVLDASSGAWLRPNGQLQRNADGVVAGNGGSIAMQTYVAPQVPFGRDPLLALPTTLPGSAGQIVANGTLRGYGFNRGASLSLRGPEFQIGGTAPADRPWTILIQPEFFASQGFGRFDLAAEYDARIAPGTELVLQQRNYLPLATASGNLTLQNVATGTDLATSGAVSIGLLDDYRRRPVDFSLTAGDYLSWGQRDAVDVNLIRSPDLSASGIRGTLTVGRNARVIGDAGAQLLLGSQNQLTVLGSLIAHGGKVTLTIDTARGGYAQNAGFFADGSAYSDSGKSIWLGPDSLIDVSGIAVVDRSSAQGLAGTDVAGRVLDGGDVVISADSGYVIAVSCTDGIDCPAIAGPKFGDNSGGTGGGGGGGSGGGGGGNTGGGGGNPDPVLTPTRRATINVSGTTATVGVLFPCTRLPTGQELFSDAGSITLGAASGLFFDASLLARAGSGAARGGSLTVTPLTGLLATSNTFEGATRLVIGAATRKLPTALQVPGQAIDPAALPSGEIYFAASTLDNSGIDSLTLGSNPTLIGNADPLPISFASNLTLHTGREISINSLHLDAQALNADGSASNAAIKINLEAPYVALHGYRNGAVYNDTPSWLPDGGSARLSVEATAIDIGGHIALDGYRQVTFAARDDIRFVTPPAFSNIPAEGQRYEAVPSVLQVSADLIFSAGRLYPATGNTAYVIADNRSITSERRSTASISFRQAGGARSTPLSVGGRLVVIADEIKQDGAIYAPGGQIYLGVAKDADDFSNFALLQYPTGGGDTGFLLPVPTRRVTFSSGSITSVSLAGLSVPYGRTLDGQNLYYNGSGDSQARVDELLQSPEKVIGATAARIDLAAGAVVDLSGGGDLVASEWIAGTGGSRDVLSQQNVRFVNGTATPVPLYADNRPVYAILPGYGGLAPFDPEFGADPLIGQSVHLNGGNGLPAGNYVLLPAAYALLPGAYRLVQDTRVGAQDALAQFTSPVLADGTLQVTGYFRDNLTGARDARSTVFQVQSAATWQQYSEYQRTSLNGYFSQQSLTENTLFRAPGDAGKLSLLAATALNLNARILAAAPTGRQGAELQIAAPQLQIVSGNATPISNYLQIDAERLNSIGASRIVLGATSIDFAGVIESFNVVATDVDISTLGAPLRAGEVVIATQQNNANDGIVVRAGAGIEAIGTPTGLNGRFISIGGLPSSFDETTGAPLDAVNGDGAFLQVSINNANLPQRDYVPGQVYVGSDGITRTVPGSRQGTLTIGDGARLTASGSLTLEASGTINLVPGAQLAAQALTASVPRITVAGSDTRDTSEQAAGGALHLGPTLQAELADIGTLTLIGGERIRFEGDTRLRAVHELVLDSGLLLSSGGTARLESEAIRFLNSEDREAILTPAVGSGSLLALANDIRFSSSRDFATLQLTSNQLFSGFGRIDLNARHALVADGDGLVDFGVSALNLDTPLFTSRSEADLLLRTGGALVAASNGAADSTLVPGLGARIAIEAGRIDWNTTLQARSGQLRLTATGGDLNLGSEAALLTQGSLRAIYDTTIAMPGGAVRLESAEGDVALAAGSLIDISSAGGGADAGSLQLVATRGAVLLDATLRGAQPGSGLGAAFTLDSGAAVDLDRLSAQLGAAGIDGAVAVHSRRGDLQLGSGQILRAADIQLVADVARQDATGGAIRIDGTLDASGSSGGRIALFGERGVAVQGVLDAHGSAADQRGGSVQIGVGGETDGSFDDFYGYQNVQQAGSGLIELASTARIDVRGGIAAGHEGGELLLRAPLLVDGGVRIDIDPSAVITGDSRPTVEAYARWDAADASVGTPHFDGVLDPSGSLGAAHASFVNTLGEFIRTPVFTFGSQLPSGQNWRARVGIDLVNGSFGINGGAITVASAWNLAAGHLDGDGRPQLDLRTAGIAPALSLRAVGDLNVSASLSDGFFQFANPFSTTAGTNNSAAPVASAGNPLPLHTASLLGLQANGQAYDSSSFRLVAGADVGSADPLALQDRFRSSADVRLDGHQTAASPLQPDRQFVLPTLIRTGVGSIDIAAAGDLRLLDAQAPGAIYTAGHAGGEGMTVAGALGSVQPGQAPVIDSGLVTPTGAGDIRIRTGGDIVGIGTIVDTDGSRTGEAGTDLRQFWWPWMQRSCLTSEQGCNGAVTQSSINFGMFAQGVLSTGGNVDVAAGGSIRELSVSLPTTYRLDASAPRGYTSFGGGNLRLSASDDLLGGSAFVADGTASLRAGGRIGADQAGATLLALQDAQFSVSAGRGLDVGGAFNPSVLFRGFDSQAYSSDSAIHLQAVSGNLIFGSTRATPGSAYGANLEQGISSVVEEGFGFLLPATVELEAPQGTLNVRRAGELFPSPVGQLSLLAQGDVLLSSPTNNAYLGLIDAPAAMLPSVLRPVSVATVQPSFINFGLQSNLRLHSEQPLHAQDQQPLRIYSELGDLVNGEPRLNYGGSLRIASDKPAVIRAGRDIVNLYFSGQNLYRSDITTIAAGRDIYEPPLVPGQSIPLIELGGPGTLALSAGRDIGPLTSANEARALGYLTLNNPQYPGIRTVGNANNAYLSREGANIALSFGVAGGVELESFAETFINPAVLHDPLDPADKLGTPDYSAALVAFVRQRLIDQAQRSGRPQPDLASLTPATAWTIFQGLAAEQRQQLVSAVFLDVLDQVGLDYNGSTRTVVDRAHPQGVVYSADNIRFVGQYGRGYAAIEALFPAASGYTANDQTGASNGATARRRTGELDMRGTTVQTQAGGDISILGPGGRVLIGSASAPPFAPETANTAAVGPNSQGLLTLQAGSIRLFADDSVLLAQSRIFTQQGGDILIWSSNGDINAGKGAKTSSEIPPLKTQCDDDLFCLVDARSQVSGAGIAALQSQPGQPAGSANLIAPVGTVDAGDAGIRVSGNLNVAALQVANADNIQVSGVKVGVPTATVDTGTVNAAASVAAAVSQTADQVAGAARAASNPELELFVEVLNSGEE